MHFQICGNNDGNIINCISISVATVLEVSKMTVLICTSHWCFGEGLKSCSARKVPLLKEAHVQARLKFTNDSEENWVKVLWSDETKIQLFGINSTRRV